MAATTTSVPASGGAVVPAPAAGPPAAAAPAAAVPAVVVPTTSPLISTGGTLTHYNFALTDIELATPVTFSTANWDFPTISGFTHKGFWAMVVMQHSVSNMVEAIELVLDFARFHFSPKVSGLPGVTVEVTIGANIHTITLDKGKTKCKPFKRGKGAGYSYTACCLATATVFEQAYHSNAAGRAACNNIPGNVNGYTQMCGTLDGWTQANQDAAQTAFANWVTTIGTNVREAAVTTKIHAASAQTIASRISSGPSAFSMRNILLVLTNNPMIVDMVTMDGATTNTAAVP